jgi:hypothetical protein
MMVGVLVQIEMRSQRARIDIIFAALITVVRGETQPVAGQVRQCFVD